MSLSIEMKRSAPPPLVGAHAKLEAVDDERDKIDLSEQIHGKLEAARKPQLCFVYSDGSVSPIQLDDPEYEKFLNACHSLKKGKENCTINFSDAIIEGDGEKTSYASADFAAQHKEIADILRKAGCRFPFRFYTSDSERSPENSPESFVRKDPRLAELRFDHKKIEISLAINDENPIEKMGEKLNMLKREQVAKRLLQLAEEQLKEMQKQKDAANDLAKQSRQNLVAQALEVITGLDRFAVQFGAIHAGLPVQKKKKKALALIQSQEAPKQYLFFHKSVDASLEEEYAKELALVDLERRSDYLQGCHSLRTHQKASPAELFFVALTQRIAKGEPVDSLFNKGALFEKAFGKLDVADQSIIREQFLAECAKLSKAYTAATLNVAPGAQAPAVPASGRPWIDLFKDSKNRGQVLQDAVQAEMSHLLSNSI